MLRTDSTNSLHHEPFFFLQVGLDDDRHHDDVSHLSLKHEIIRFCGAVETRGSCIGRFCFVFCHAEGREEIIILVYHRTREMARL